VYDLVIKGGRIIDQTGDRFADVAINGSQIVEVGPNLDHTGAVVIDASECVVGSGLVDLHTHLREPGKEDAETIESGSRAAVLGGFTALVAMPNTDPTVDSAAVVQFVLDAGKRSLCDVQTSAAITVGRRGDELAPMAELAALGVRIFTDDGNGVQNDLMMRRAMEYARDLDVTLAQHCEIDSLSAGGQMHEGEWSSRLGIPGIPAEAEEVMIQRDLALASLTGAKLHFQHLSTAGAVALLRDAKTRGLPVTAEATTHHFTLTHAEVASFDPVFKVNPPLRTSTDVEAIRLGLADGTIDVIATDHAPHTQQDKEEPFDLAPPGMIGLETALGLSLTELDLPIERILALLSWQPATIAGLSQSHGGPIVAGRAANICVFDPNAQWKVEETGGASLSRNTPYRGRTLTGKVRHTIVFGEAVVIDSVAQR